MDNTTHGYTDNHQQAMTYSDLEDKTGESRAEWAQRIWDTVDEREYMFLRAVGTHGNGSCTTSRLHFPVEFPSSELDAEPNEKVGGDPTACQRHSSVAEWQFKSVAVYPVDYRDVCKYCLNEFWKWWDSPARTATVPRGDVHG